MRLDRYLSEHTPYTRSEIKQLIRDQRVSVDEQRATRAQQPVLAQQQKICVDDVRILPRGNGYLMLHKPDGYLCANVDADKPVVTDLLRDSEFASQSWQIVGRLDLETTGLVLLTTDGQWNHRITSPNSQCGKRYRVELAHALAPESEQQLCAGILLHGEKRPTRPAHIERLAPTTVLITIYEGRYHQVKRMFAACGNRVLKLHREAIGALSLDPTLAPGAFRPLQQHELALVIQDKADT